VNAIQKPLSGFQTCSPKASRSISSFGSGFTELHAKLDANMLLDFAIHRRQKENEVDKALL
jgi:hypothetical protein